MRHAVRLVTALSIAILILFSSSAEAQQARWDLEESWRIGSLDSTDWITRVSDLAVSADGQRLVVGQPLTFEVLVIDAQTGQRKISLGRRGGGPGEFAVIQTVGMVGDTIFAADLQQQRVVLFSLESGTHIRTSRVDGEVIAEARRPPFPMRLTSNGTYWAEPPLNYTLVANGMVDGVPVLLLNEDGSVRARLATKRVNGTIAFAPLGRGYYLFQQPLVRPSIVAYSSDGSSMLHVENRNGGTANIRRFSQTGDLLYDHTLPSRRRRIANSTVDSLHAAFSRRFSDMGPEMQAAAKRMADQHVVVPDNLPSFSEAVLASDGTAWLRGTLSDEWLVVAPTGMPIGSVVAPPGVRIMAIHGSSAWGIWNDSFDVPHIAKYVLKPR